MCKRLDWTQMFLRWLFLAMWMLCSSSDWFDSSASTTDQRLAGWRHRWYKCRPCIVHLTIYCNPAVSTVNCYNQSSQPDSNENILCVCSDLDYFVIHLDRDNRVQFRKRRGDTVACTERRSDHMHCLSHTRLLYINKLENQFWQIFRCVIFHGRKNRNYRTRKLDAGSDAKTRTTELLLQREKCYWTAEELILVSKYPFIMSK